MFHFLLKSILRNLLRNRTFSVINIIGMSLGIACTIIIFSWAHYEFSFDRFHEKGDRIYRLIERQYFKGQDEKFLAAMPEWLINTFEEDIESVEASTGIRNMGTIWLGEGDSLIPMHNASLADNKIFEIFSFKFISGNPRNALSDPSGVVLTRSAAERLFKGESPIGKRFKYQDIYEFEVTGVIEDIPDNSHIQFDMLVSIEGFRQYWNLNNYNHTTNIYLLLKPGQSPEDIYTALQDHKDRFMPYNANMIEFQLQPLFDQHLRSSFIMWGTNYKKSNIIYVRSFMLIGLLIILVSCINYINLATASASKRYRETSIKKIIGSSRIQLVFQFMIESFVLLFISFWFSLLLIEIVRTFLQNLGLDILLFGNYFNYKFISLSLLLVTLLSLISGIYPAIYLTSFSSLDAFKRTYNTKTRKFPIRKGLVIIQLTISCILIIGVIIISRQVEFMKSKDMGFNRESILICYTTEPIQEKYDLIKTELLADNSIIEVTSSNIPLGTPMWRNGIHFEGKDENTNWVTPYMMVDYNFIDFYDIELAKGRAFSEEYALDKHKEAYLINETLAEKLPYDNPIGKKFRTSAVSDVGEIVGIVKNFNYRSLHHNIETLVIQLGVNYKNVLSVKINSLNYKKAIQHLEDTWYKYESRTPFNYYFLDQGINDLYQSEFRTIQVVGIFSILSIVISCIGLFGLILYITQGKTKEIGVRKVNGATIGNIVYLLSRDLLLNIVLSLMIACPISLFAVTKWLQGFAYKTTIGWWVFVLSGIIVAIFALLAVSWQSIQAARKNPVDSLRYE
jgi:putative ABC transport system permease protein